MVLICAQGNIKKVKKAKVAVFTCGLGLSQTETKGTVLIKNKDEMLNFTTGEEKHMEKVNLTTIFTTSTAINVWSRDRSSPSLQNLA